MAAAGDRVDRGRRALDAGVTDPAARCRGRIDLAAARRGGVRLDLMGALSRAAAAACRVVGGVWLFCDQPDPRSWHAPRPARSPIAAALSARGRAERRVAAGERRTLAAGPAAFRAGCRRGVGGGLLGFVL